MNRTSLISTTAQFLLFALLTLTATHACAGPIVDWNFADNTGATSSEAPSFAANNISGLNFELDSGLRATSATGAMASDRWNGNSPSNRITFGFEVAPGNTLALDNLWISTRSTATGPGTLGLYYSGDSFSSPLHVFNQSTDTTLQSQIDLSGLSSLFGSIEFSIQEIGNTQASGSGNTGSTGIFFVENYNGSTPVRFSGTVSAVPEPTACLPIAMLLVMRTMRRHRRVA